MKFGAKLQELRQQAALSQPDFAERVGLSVGAVRDYEQGRRLPSWPVIVRLAHALKVTVDEFSKCDEVVITPEAPVENPPKKKPKR